MNTAAQIKIFNQLAGAVLFDEAKGLGFVEFEPSFLQKGLDIAPLKMPIAKARQTIFSFPELAQNSTFKGMPGLLADVLPDKYGNALINTWLAKNGRPTGSLNPVETLCFIGKRGMGALEFLPVTPKTPNNSTVLHIDMLVQIAQHILADRQHFNESLGVHYEKALSEILKIGTSAGGARAKAIIAYNPLTKEVKSGQTNAPEGFSHWLIKFDGVTDAQFGASAGYGRVEMAYYKMALDAGIDMMPSMLLEENDRAHFMTRRFDRPTANTKLHVQTFCAMQHYDFNEVGMYSYEQLFETMRTLQLPYPQQEQLFRRMVFNAIARNCDDHTKNVAFVMNQQGEWALSPAYDICHAYRPGSAWVSQQSMSINGKRDGFTNHDFLTVAQNMNIKKAPAIIQQITNVVQQWNDYADEQKVPATLRDAIKSSLLYKCLLF
ncbi:type II toxin-antitoxin system HipA family toxin [Ferruginibacter yonginensis]|uniref:Type II toxin-antitoxin system HipA family toxin n=1 Tax=Ferruginibacter yonginensis TaxID=1310416 RepID=A0ABV8QNJ3_9BACT